MGRISGVTLTAITAITGVAAGGVGVGGGVLVPGSRSGIPALPDLDLGLGPDAPRTEANEGCVLGHAPAMLPPRFDTTRRQRLASSVAPRRGTNIEPEAQLVEGDRNRTRRWPTTSPPGEWSPGQCG